MLPIQLFFIDSQIPFVLVKPKHFMAIYQLSSFDSYSIFLHLTFPQIGKFRSAPIAFFIKPYSLFVTLWYFDIAMENCPFIGGFAIKIWNDNF